MHQVFSHLKCYTDEETDVSIMS